MTELCFVIFAEKIHHNKACLYFTEELSCCIQSLGRRSRACKWTNEDYWQEILSEDATHPYNTHHLSYPPPPAVSDDDIHEEGEGLEGDSPNLIDLDPLNPEAYAFSVDL